MKIEVTQYQAKAMWLACKVMIEEEIAETPSDHGLLMESMSVLAVELDKEKDNE